MVQRVGVIGGGQLAWMMAGAATKLGVELVVQTPATSDPAVTIAANTVLAPVADAAATAQLAAQTEVITFENEFVDLVALSALADRGVCFRPKLSVLQPLLDKFDQRSYLQNLGLPTPKFWAFNPSDEGDKEVFWSFPIVLKTRRHGYDGQGTFILRNQAELQATIERLPHVPLLVEEFVPFDRELAAIAARSVTGEIALYPIVETQQEQQVCRRVFAPASVSPSVLTQVEAIVRTLLTGLDAVGIFGIELFLTKDDQVLVNEIAPRTHNSGHFTLDACTTSQFEQHLRAVSGLPLGDPAMRSPAAVMVNLLGYEHSQSDYLSQRQQLAALPGAHVHWYGKTESRPGRKLGHVTVLLPENDRSQLDQVAAAIESIWYTS
ncbi:5-(carboxyamino)imidazole ribonucleotide synthase [Pantanalinema rosaneae CENA516]|uniref:5-(carboxyamino)imidazole ribonucleotide synthase n=1 Tax=Pantanalinema rosaneae TaxID=1620701 RepID=UPI003D6E58C7